MLQTKTLQKRTCFYYDLEKKTIGRIPTNSNLLTHGSDNSLYFGMIDNEEVASIFKSLFDVDDIQKVSGQTYRMTYNNHIVETAININQEGQIQIKITGDGAMAYLLRLFCNDNSSIDTTRLLFVMDFINMEVRFVSTDTLVL